MILSSQEIKNFVLSQTVVSYIVVWRKGASEGWKDNFLPQNEFTMRVVTRNKNVIHSKEQMIEEISLQIETRLL